MHRIDSSTAEADKFGAGKDGFTEGEPGVTAATETTDDWFDGVQEEICSPIEAVDITLVKNTRNQLLRAIQRFIGSLAASNWVASTPAGSPGAFYAIAHDGSGLWCAVGASGEIQTSPDGVNWTARTAAGAFSGNFNGVAHNGSNLWCAVGSSGEIQTSPDGTTWTQRTAAGSYSDDFQDVFHDKSGLWCAVGETGEIQTSPDGTTWTARTAAGGYSSTFKGVTHDESGLWVICGYAKEIQTSPDGTTWTQRNTGGSGAADAFMDVDYNGEDLFASANNDGDVYTSPDGTTWTQRSIASGDGPANAVAIRYDRDNGLNVWIIGGTPGASGTEFAVSYDAITWKPVAVASAVLTTVSGIGVHRGRQFLAVGSTDIAGCLLFS